MDLGFGQKQANLGPNRALKWVFGKWPNFELDLSVFTYYDGMVPKYQTRPCVHSIEKDFFGQRFANLVTDYQYICLFVHNIP